MTIPTREEILAFRQRQQEARENIENKKLEKLILEPSAVKNIFRIKPTPELENKYIKTFIAFPHADPTQYTMAMEGKPLIVLVTLNNGLSYRAAMTRLAYIDWPGGLTDRLSPRPSYFNLDEPNAIQPKGYQDKRPIIIADNIYYGLILQPVRENNKTLDRDQLEIRWHEKTNIQTATQEDLGGTALPRGPFWGLFEDIGIPDYPPHMLKLFSDIQNHYDKTKKLLGYGKSIYTLMDPLGEPRGHGWTIPSLEQGYRIHYEIPAIKLINPNQPLKLVHRPKVIQRIAIPAPQERLERN